MARKRVVWWKVTTAFIEKMSALQSPPLKTEANHDSLTRIFRGEEQWMTAGAAVLGAALGLVTGLFGNAGAAESFKRAVLGALIGLILALLVLFYHRRSLGKHYAAAIKKNIQ